MYDAFVRFKALVKNQFKHKIVTLYSDNGGEYQALDRFLSTNGISYLTTPPHTPEHNGLSERRHRHIVETGLSFLTHASMPLTYWTYAFATAVYFINRMPTPILHLSSPFEKLFESQPNYTKLWVFGCLCYPCVFLGYSSTQSAYMCLDLSTSKTFISRHVKFLENSLPFTTNQFYLSYPTPEIISKWLPLVQILPISSRSLNTPPQKDSLCQNPSQNAQTID